MNMIILTKDDALGVQRYKLTDHRAEHICRVLRSVAGDAIEVGLLDGPSGIAVIEEIAESQIVLRCDWHSAKPQDQPIIDVVCALPRPQTLKKILHSSAAMGVRQLHLIRADRVEKSYFHSPLLQEKNYTRYLLQGLSQGKHTRIPQVHIHHYFKRFFQDTLPTLEKTEPTRTKKLLPELDIQTRLDEITLTNCKRIITAIGPEGGWVPFEIDLMNELGFEKFKIGPWTLRTENALIAAISQIELAKQNS